MIGMTGRDVEFGVKVLSNLLEYRKVDVIRDHSRLAIAAREVAQLLMGTDHVARANIENIIVERIMRAAYSAEAK